MTILHTKDRPTPLSPSAVKQRGKAAHTDARLFLVTALAKYIVYSANQIPCLYDDLEFHVDNYDSDSSSPILYPAASTFVRDFSRLCSALSDLFNRNTTNTINSVVFLLAPNLLDPRHLYVLELPSSFSGNADSLARQCIRALMTSSLIPVEMKPTRLWVLVQGIGCQVVEGVAPRRDWRLGKILKRVTGVVIKIKDGDVVVEKCEPDTRRDKELWFLLKHAPAGWKE